MNGMYHSPKPSGAHSAWGSASGEKPTVTSVPLSHPSDSGVNRFWVRSRVSPVRYISPEEPVTTLGSIQSASPTGMRSLSNMGNVSSS